MNAGSACMTLALVAVLMSALGRPAAASPSEAAPKEPPTGKPRVYVSNKGSFISLDALLDELARADVVLVGERHDSPAGHVLERTLLEGLFKRRPAITVSMEMLERDVQATVDGYVSGNVDEKGFLERSRPWPSFAAYWKPLVDFAREQHLPLLAANVPRSLASAVAAQGLATLLSLPVHVRGFAARHVSAPRDASYEAFAEQMRAHPHHGGPDLVANMYEAQCLKDDTMAESIADWRERVQASNPLVVHYTGMFHIEGNRGTASRLRERAPRSAVKTVILSPDPDPDRVDAKKLEKRGDYVIVYPE